MMVLDGYKGCPMLRGGFSVTVASSEYAGFPNNPVEWRFREVK
jgi:hypothetical protein